MKNLFAVIGGLVVVAVCGCVGLLVLGGGLELTVLAVENPPAPEFLPTKPGNVYLAVQARVRNVDREEAPYNPVYFRVKDGSAFEYSATLSVKDPAFLFGTLARGQSAAGWVTFEVPAGARGFVLTYEPLVILGGYEPLRVDLGR